MFDFSKKVVLITGASSGIGEALAREFHRKGAHLVLAARRIDRLEKLAEEFEHPFQKTLVFTCDVTREKDLRNVVSSAVQSFGHLDVTIANAGFGVVGEVSKLSMEDFRRQFETNVFGVLHTVKAVLDELKRTKGRLVLIGSVNGYLSLPGNAPYAMSKFAVRALSKSLFHELYPLGVSVTHIAPGFIESEIRKVDNSGAYHAKASDRIPRWLCMPAEKAAKKIVRAIYYRRQERIVTAHGYWAVWIERHFPWFFTFLFRFSGLKARSQPQY